MEIGYQSSTRPAASVNEQTLLAGKRRARLNEAVIGLVFVAPVAIIAFVFELFPVAYGFYISMQGGVNVPEGFVGLEHFVQAIGSLAYMIALAVALVLGLAGYGMYRRALRAMQAGEGNFYPYLAPGFITATATLGFFGLLFSQGIGPALFALAGMLLGVAWFAVLQNQRVKLNLPGNPLTHVISAWGVGLTTLGAVLLTWFTFYEIHDQAAPLLDVMRVAITDRRYSYIFPLIQQIAALGAAFAGIVGIFVISATRQKIDKDERPGIFGLLALTRVFLFVGVMLCIFYVLAAQDALLVSLNQLSRLTPDQLREFTRIRIATFTVTVSYWSEVFTMLIGVGAILLALVFWGNARRRETTMGMLTTIFVAICLMIGGWLFIGELPSALGKGDSAFYDSLIRTAVYATLTVPVQLSIGLGLAYLLFYEVKWGKSFFRLVYFMPYIAPTVATATVFAMIFSNSADVGPANQILKALGLPPQEWLRTTKGLFQIIAEWIGGSGVRLPLWLSGPSLPLLAAIFYAIWVFSGYNAVIFMAGLGNVPKEMFEAAQVDGAGRWSTFRHVVFPLISPTTFFLTLLAITGTFRAFTHIWVLRTEDMRGALDTTTVYIYNTILETSVLKTRPYAAAMSFLLFGIILILTIIQNRLSRDRVFYG